MSSLTNPSAHITGAEENKWPTFESGIILGFKKTMIDSPKIVCAEWNAPVANYIAETDTINIPLASKFENGDEFICVLIHELVHSTGHLKRLNRETISNKKYQKDKKMRALEEIIAELGTNLLLECYVGDPFGDECWNLVSQYLELFDPDEYGSVVRHAHSDASRAVLYLHGIIER